MVYANIMLGENVQLGKFCVVAAGSFVTTSFPDFSIVGGTPAKLIRNFSDSEIKKLAYD